MIYKHFATALCALYVGFLSADAVGTESLPVANFTALQSSMTEQDGTVELKVIFSREYSGRLTYSVDGTAEQEADYGSRVIVNKSGDASREAAIVIDIRDDALMEETETIRVTLLPGEGFNPGPEAEHTVHIQDNDVNWRVMHDVEGMQFDYGIQIIREGENITATARSDGGSGLPAGAYPVTLTATDTRFEAVVGPVTVAADQTLLGVELSRTFTLVANRPEDGSQIDYGRPLFGIATETWTASEGAAYLNRRDPISGTFLMARTAAETAPVNSRMERVSAETTRPANLAALGSECAIDGLRKTSGFTVKPSITRESLDMSPGKLDDLPDVRHLSGSFGHPFAPHIPYPDFINETLGRAQTDLYYDKAPTQPAKNAAAFRYKVLLYKKEEVDAGSYIRAQFDEIEDHWDCAARRRAHETAQTLIGALRYVPWNRELRWALLDIYHDIAVAEKAVARQRHAAVAETMLKEPMPGESLIHQEISHLEEALVLYRHALAGYMQVLQHTFGVDVADFEGGPELLDESLGVHMFRTEVPSRSPLSTSLERGVGGKSDEPVLEGYKDVTLLFELLREYLRAAAQLSKRYILRNDPSDLERAEQVIGSALLATWLEGNALLAIFPEVGEAGAETGPSSGAREAVAGWRHSYSALGHIRSFLSGDANILGFADDFLALTQSTIPGDPTSQFFDSYDFFAQYMGQNIRSPLQRAIMDLTKARGDYDNYQHRSDQLAQQLSARNEQYDSRLMKIVGVRPGETGYKDPVENEGGLIRQKALNIDAARLRIEKNHQRIENLNERIRIEVWRRGQEKGINDAISDVYVDFGGKQEKLTRKIAEIREHQMNARNASSLIGSFFTAAVAVAGVVAAPVTGGASLLATAGAVGKSYSDGVNMVAQLGTETEKGETQALKERYAAQERAEIHSLNDKLLGTQSRARVKTLLLDMSLLALDSREAAIALKLEMEQLAALYLEKEDLERRKVESDEWLAARYFADPSHRLLKNASLLRSEYSFAEAQRWMFLTIRAAEYKWNQTFVHESDDGVFSMKTLFTARNAHELDRLFNALTDWDKTLSITARSENGFKVFSIREDFLGYENGGAYFDPEGKPVNSIVAFQHFMAQPENYLDPEDPENPIPGFKVLRLRFSTAFVPGSGGLFLPNRWLEKVEYLKVRLIGGALGGINTTVDGYLNYGGVSLIRNQSRGSEVDDDPSRLVDEYTTYSTRYWYDKGGEWYAKESLGAPISVQVARDPDVPFDVYQIDAFKEYSVATTEWMLYVAVEKEGHKLVDLDNLTDIEFRIHFYFRYPRH